MNLGEDMKVKRIPFKEKMTEDEILLRLGVVKTQLHNGYSGFLEVGGIVWEIIQSQVSPPAV